MIHLAIYKALLRQSTQLKSINKSRWDQKRLHMRQNMKPPITRRHIYKKARCLLFFFLKRMLFCTRGAVSYETSSDLIWNKRKKKRKPDRDWLYEKYKNKEKASRLENPRGSAQPFYQFSRLKSTTISYFTTEGHGIITLVAMAVFTEAIPPFAKV